MKTRYKIFLITISILLVSYVAIISSTLGPEDVLNPACIIYFPSVVIQLAANEGNGIICVDACGPCSAWGPHHLLVDGECKIPDKVGDCYSISPPMEWIFVNGQCKPVDEEGNLLYDGKCKEGEVEMMPNSCFLLTDVVFGHANKKKEQGWKLYPGGSGWMPPSNSTLTPIYKDVDFGVPPLDFEAMLDDKIFVNKCESNGGMWNYTYHDCEGLEKLCTKVGGLHITRDITPPCTDTGIINNDPLKVKVCRGPEIIRMSCVFEYED